MAAPCAGAARPADAALLPAGALGGPRHPTGGADPAAPDLADTGDGGGLRRAALIVFDNSYPTSTFSFAMPQVTLNSATATLVVPSDQDRRWIYLENSSGVDIRWGFDSSVAMTGSGIGALLKTGERREYAADQFGPVGDAIYAIAASGTPSLTWLKNSL